MDDASPFAEPARPLLTAQAVHFADVLRHLAEHADATPADIAKHSVKLIHNIKRDLPKLEDAELVIGREGRWSLTDHGRLVVEALDRAEKPGVAGELLQQTLTVDQLVDNPFNPPGRLDPFELQVLADQIEAAGRVLEPVTVSEPDDAGRRLLWNGHRRKYAVLRLVELGHDPADFPFTFRESVAAEGCETIVAAETLLVLNGGRPLTPHERFVAFTTYQAAAGLSAREAGKRTGVDARTAAEMVKVKAQAAEADIDAWGRGELTWQQLRESVRTPEEKQAEDKEEWANGRRERIMTACAALTPRQVMILVEVIDRCRRQPSDAASSGRLETYFDPVAKLQMTSADHAAWMSIGGGFSYGDAPVVTVSDVAVQWVIDAGLEPIGERRAEVLTKVRSEGAGLPAAMWADREGVYLTPWLNYDRDADPCVYAGVRYLNPTHAGEAKRRAEGSPGSVAPPAKPAELTPLETWRRLDNYARLAMLELHHALQGGLRAYRHEERQWWPAPAYWLSASAAALGDSGARLVTFSHKLPGQTTPCVAFTEAGLAALQADGNGGGIAESTLRAFRLNAGIRLTAEGVYSTPWLNEPAAPAAGGDAAPPGAAFDAAAVSGEPLTGDTAAEAEAEDDDDGPSLHRRREAVTFNNTAAQWKGQSPLADFEAAGGAERLEAMLSVITEGGGPYAADEGDDPSCAGNVYDNNGACILTVDVHGDCPLHDAQALGALVALCLNTLSGHRAFPMEQDL